MFEEFNVVTTSTAAWSKDTGYHSYLELKTNKVDTRDAQRQMDSRAEGVFEQTCLPHARQKS